MSDERSDRPAVPADFEEQFRSHGFLADAMTPVADLLQECAAVFFDYADDLNTLGQDRYFEAAERLRGKALDDPVRIGVQIMSRALSSFQGAILLARNGMQVESLTLTRCVYEAAFWIGYLHEDGENARDTLFYATHEQDLTIYVSRLLGSEGEARTDLLTEMSRIGKIAKAAKRSKVSRKSMDQIASASGFNERYDEYRYLCGSAAHVNPRSLLSNVAETQDGVEPRYAIGPSQAQVPLAVVFACKSLRLAIEAVGKVSGAAVPDPQLELAKQRGKMLEQEANRILAAANGSRANAGED